VGGHPAGWGGGGGGVRGWGGGWGQQPSRHSPARQHPQPRSPAPRRSAARQTELDNMGRAQADRPDDPIILLDEMTTSPCILNDAPGTPRRALYAAFDIAVKLPPGQHSKHTSAPPFTEAPPPSSEPYSPTPAPPTPARTAHVGNSAPASIGAVSTMDFQKKSAAAPRVWATPRT